MGGSPGRVETGSRDEAGWGTDFDPKGRNVRFERVAEEEREGQEWRERRGAVVDPLESNDPRENFIPRTSSPVPSPRTSTSPFF